MRPAGILADHLTPTLRTGPVLAPDAAAYEDSRAELEVVVVVICEGARSTAEGKRASEPTGTPHGWAAVGRASVKINQSCDARINASESEMRAGSSEPLVENRLSSSLQRGNDGDRASRSPQFHDVSVAVWMLPLYVIPLLKFAPGNELRTVFQLSEARLP